MNGSQLRKALPCEVQLAQAAEALSRFKADADLLRGGALWARSRDMPPEEMTMHEAYVGDEKK